jgi:RES domain-containing protein
MRVVRQPPSQAEFDSIAIAGSADASLLDVLPWFRLASTAFSSQFFASPGSRLTPISMAFPCVYLAEDKVTTVAEIWGDRFYAQRKAKMKLYSIAKSDAEALRFLQSGPLPSLTLCDLTDSETRQRVGIDSATLYTTDLSVPQGWAEVLARHPRNFDGILYRSRHTDRLCIVAWNRPGRLLDHEFTFPDASPFLESPESYTVAQTMGLALSFAY